LLTRSNIDQIFDEHNVYELDPEAEQQNLAAVVFAIGDERSRVLDRESRLEDGVFASLAICIPSWKQNHSYTELMQSRRREWFSDISEDAAVARARSFFRPSLLQLELYELGNLVASKDAATLIQAHLGSPQVEL
jgi:hypothetical protein